MLAGTINCYELWITEDARYLYLIKIPYLQVFQNVDGTFSFMQELTGLSSVISIGSSFDGEYLILGNATNQVVVYHLDGNYIPFQTIIDSSFKV